MLLNDEFIEYIRAFNKKPGQYTYEEEMQIGLKMKELPISQRNWNQLHEILGITEFTANAYRQRVDKLTQSREEKAGEGFIYKDNFIEKQKVRDWYNAFRRDLREEVRIENFKEEIENAADKFKKLPLIKFEKDGTKRENEAILVFSDLHIGAECDNFYNTYNIQVATERVKKLVAKTINYCKANNVKTLNFLNLGDLIHGIIHTNSRIEQEMDVTEQIMQAAELIAQALNELQKAAPIVTYRSVLDNHSRAVADKNQHIEKEQFSRLIDWFVKERLKNSDIKFIDNTIDRGVDMLTLTNGKKVMYAHGHQDNKNASVQSMIGLTREWIDYIILAHFHNPAVKEYQGCKVFINGSIVGTESYAFGKRLFSKPSQKLLIFNDKDSDIQDIEINLE